MFKKIVLASAILAATAGVASANPAPYLGASVGVSNVSSKNVAGLANYHRGVPFKLFAGYGGIVSDSLYLAGELEGTVGTANITDKNALKTTYGFGLSVIPGVQLSKDTLAYVRAGVVRTRFKEVKKYATGGQFGFGLQTAVASNIDLRGEYDFTAYKNVANIKAPRSDAFNLGLVYKFN